MVNINLSSTFLRYTISTITRAIPLVIRLYTNIPDERGELGLLSAFLTTLKAVLSSAVHESENSRDEVIPWEYEDPMDMENTVQNLLNDFEKEI